MQMETERKYGVARRVWRLIYPAVLYIAFIYAMEFFIVFAHMAVDIARAGFDFSLASQAFDAGVLFLYSLNMVPLILTNTVLIVVFYNIYRKSQHRDATFREGNLLKPTILAALMLFAYEPLITFLGWLIDLGSLSPEYVAYLEVIEKLPIWIQILGLVVLPPICEELCLRAVILNRAMKWMPKWTAVLVASVIFAVMHLNWAQGLIALVAGIVLGTLYVRYRSITLCILAHAANNLAGILIMNYLPPEWETACNIASLLLFIACVALISRTPPRHAVET
jgi:membrane protease YdiL (CAAX protease family)